MIRVIYRWQVKAGKEDIFRHAWERGTLAICRTFKGSHGSVLLQHKKMSSEFSAVAKWDSVEDWASAHKDPQWPPDPEAVRSVKTAAGKTISTDVFEEISDLTADD